MWNWGMCVCIWFWVIAAGFRSSFSRPLIARSTHSINVRNDWWCVMHETLVCIYFYVRHLSSVEIRSHYPTLPFHLRDLLSKNCTKVSFFLLLLFHVKEIFWMSTQGRLQCDSLFKFLYWQLWSDWLQVWRHVMSDILLYVTFIEFTKGQTV